MLKKIYLVICGEENAYDVLYVCTKESVAKEICEYLRKQGEKDEFYADYCYTTVQEHYITNNLEEVKGDAL